MPHKEARYYKQLDRQRVECLLCPHHCKLTPDKTGLCRVRVNREGRLVTINYGELASLALDPIEKKPLYHFHPGRLILSAGTFGCNLACAFCQNYSLAQEQPPTRATEVEELLQAARATQKEGSVGVAFTYNEPSIWYEYVREAAEVLQENDLRVVLVTNGFIEPEPFRELLPLVDALNIDVKAFTDDFYVHHCRGALAPVRATVETAVEKAHVEVTTLLVPEENDAIEEVEELARWLAALNPHIPLHLSRYHPAYRFSRPATPPESLYRAREAALKHLDFVYLGNLPGEQNHTACLECGNLLIQRHAYQVQVSGLREGHCTRCGANIDYIVEGQGDGPFVPPY